MELSSDHATQLLAALLFGLIAYAATVSVAPRKILAILVILIPFQMVTSRYGTLNVVAVYLVFLGLLIRSAITYTPLLGVTIFIFFAYFLSILGALQATWFDHCLYLITIGSNFLLFYITYNVFVRYPNARFALRLLIVMDILTVGYALALYFFGFERLAFFGVEEWTLNQNLEDLQRLMGAFQAAGVNAAFYATQIIVVAYAALFSEKGFMKYLCYLLILINFALIIASGSRGSFLTLLSGGILMLYLLKPALGAARTSRLLIIGGLCLAAMSVYVVTQTEFNVLFERLSTTEVNETGVPDTRQTGFDVTLKRLDETLFTGHGPRIILFEEEIRIILGYKPLGFFPHNLLLFLVYTVGVTGLTAYVIFFSKIFLQFLNSRKNRCPYKAVRYMPKLGIVVMVMFFLDQLKIEFLRFMFGDYQHYMFFLLGMLMAFSKVASKRKLYYRKAASEN